MPEITFQQPDGTCQAIQLTLGQTVMEGARDAGIVGIAAECGGACACATCHVFIAAEWVERLPKAADMEVDMLDFAPGYDPARSRLSCQLRVTAEFDGLLVRIPEEQG